MNGKARAKINWVYFINVHLREYKTGDRTPSSLQSIRTRLAYKKLVKAAFGELRAVPEAVQVAS